MASAEVVQRERELTQAFVLLGANEFDGGGLAERHVVSGLGLRRWREERRGQLLRLLQTGRDRETADLPRSWYSCHRPPNR